MEKEDKHPDILPYKTMRTLGSAVGASCSMVRGAGNCIKRSWQSVFSFGSRQPVQVDRPDDPRQEIREVVLEEIRRLQSQNKRMSLLEMEKRLSVMTKTVVLMQKKLNELSAEGPVSDADMFRVIGSIDTGQSLTQGEKSMLANVFRQNVVLQKPEMQTTL
ncbi:MAG: hypothetical protein HQ515_10020 [Phycisphaeraceae bacterium]|nr:hypothetical protein [Phycisphaeraceae bacterium]